MGPLTVKLFSFTLTFYNYVPFRLHYDSGEFVIESVLLILLLLVLFTIKPAQYGFLDKSKLGTDQMRGLAMLLVILYHYIGVVMNDGNKYADFINNTFNIGSVGVSCFLLLSGYGLMRSYMEKGIEKNALVKRFSRVLIPYWMITLCWLVLDKLLLHHSFAFTQMIRIILGGVFSNSTENNVDIFMWYISFILLNYVFFTIIMRTRYAINIKLLFLFMLSLSFFLLTLNIPFAVIGNIQFATYVSNVAGWHIYFLSFPVGVLLAYYIDPISSYIYSFKDRIGLMRIILFLIVFCTVIAIQSSQLLFGFIPILIILLFSMAGIVSRFLLFLGAISYELYLLHGPLMMRYDFLLFKEPHALWFFIYLVVIIGAAILLQYLSSYIFKLWSLLVQQHLLLLKRFGLTAFMKE